MKIVKIYSNMDRKCKRYAMACLEVIENNNLSFSAKTVYTLLAGYAMNKDICYPSVRELQRKLGCSFTTIDKALKQLEDEGIIAIDKQYKNTYRLLVTVELATKNGKDATESVACSGSKNATVFSQDATLFENNATESVAKHATESVAEEYNIEDNKKIKEKEYIYTPPFDLKLPIAVRNRFGKELLDLTEEERKAWDSFVNWAVDNAETKLFRFQDPLSPAQYTKLMNSWQTEDERAILKRKIRAVLNKIDVEKTNYSAFKTIQSWCENDFSLQETPKRFKTA